jgi:hypothetical protein
MKRIISLMMAILLITGTIIQPVFAASPDSKLLKVPYNLTAVQMVADDANPFAGVDLTFNVDNLPFVEGDGTIAGSYWIEVEKKIGETGSWEYMFHNPTDSFNEVTAANGLKQYSTQDVWSYDQKNTLLSYRVRNVIYNDSFEVTSASAWSNVAYVGLKSSPWATPKINDAIKYGLVPESIANDLTKPITREEFAELAVRLYELYTGTVAEPSPLTTFTDCANPEVLKAFKLGIVSGMGNNKFTPKALTNREQIAAMLRKAVQAIAPTTDFSTAGAPKFGDEKLVKPYFIEAVRFMSKKGFIVGSGGNYSPLNTCTREAAVTIAVKVYEFYLVK